VIRAVGFDLDDTLLDHRGAASRAIAELVRAQKWVYQGGFDFGLEWQHLEEAHFAQYIAGKLTTGGQRRARMRDFVAMAGMDFQDGELDQLFEEFLFLYAKSWAAFPDVFPTLETLRNAGFRMAVLTSGLQSQQEAKLSRMGVLEMFDSVLAIGTLTAPKPDPRAFLQLCSVFGRTQDEVVYVGDDVFSDVIAATKAGLHGVWLNRDGRDAPVGVRTQIRTLTSLATTLSERNG
jgi:putative hydrolase of the HAD superfamily